MGSHFCLFKISFGYFLFLLLVNDRTSMTCDIVYHIRKCSKKWLSTIQKWNFSTFIVICVFFLIQNWTHLMEVLRHIPLVVFSTKKVRSVFLISPKSVQETKTQDWKTSNFQGVPQGKVFGRIFVQHFVSRTLLKWLKIENKSSGRESVGEKKPFA